MATGTSASLSSLSGTEGVRGSVVFDRFGMCTASDLPPPYDPMLLAEFIKRLGGSFDVFSSLDQDGVSSFFASCEGGGLLLRKSDVHTVVVLTKPDVNMNLLNVALNVLALNLARESASDSSGSRSSTAHSMGTSHTNSMLSQSGAAAGEIIPPDAVGKAAVMRLLNVYTDFMGPAARTVLKRQLAELGVSSRTLRRPQFGDLVDRLAAKLPSASRQAEFIALARQIRE